MTHLNAIREHICTILKRPFREDLVTPVTKLDTIALDRQRKKRGQPIDQIRKLSDGKIKRNHLTVRDTLRDQVKLLVSHIRSINGLSSISSQNINTIHLILRRRR